MEYMKKVYTTRLLKTNIEWSNLWTENGNFNKYSSLSITMTNNVKRYVDGYVLPVSRKNLKAYQKMAQEAGSVWMKHGALAYYECVGEDLKSTAKWGCLPFHKMMKAKPNETIIFAFIVYKSRKHRDEVNAKVLKDPLMNPERHKDKPMPFEMNRMAVGGFETIVNLGVK
jgi:uncharacterized protein YbaA (DUF1428 family)